MKKDFWRTEVSIHMNVIFRSQWSQNITNLDLWREINRHPEHFVFHMPVFQISSCHHHQLEHIVREQWQIVRNRIQFFWGFHCLKVFLFQPFFPMIDLSASLCCMRMNLTTKNILNKVLFLLVLPPVFSVCWWHKISISLTDLSFEMGALHR